MEKAIFPDPWEADVLMSMCRSNTDKLYAVVDSDNGEKVVAYCCIQTVLDESEILRIAVVPEMRRKGIAKEFFAEVIGEIKKAGSVSVFLEVRCENLPAIGLYKSAGFEELCIRKNYYGKGQDASILKLNISG